MSGVSSAVCSDGRSVALIPSGVECQDPDLSTRDRLAFGALSKAMTGVRGLGYYREYLNHLRDSDATRERVPVLEE